MHISSLRPDSVMPVGLFALILGLAVAVPGLFGTPGAAFALTLEDTLRAAMGNSLSLQSARESWLASREDIGVSASTSEWRATGTVTGNQYKTDAAGATKTGYLDSQSLNATVSLSRNLYDGGQTRENSRLRALQLEIAEARYFAAEQQVLLQAVETYLSVVKAERRVEINQANVERLKQHVTAARVRLEAGASTQTQLAQAEARLSRARTTLIDSLTALRNAEDSFLTITGTPPENLNADIDAGQLPSTLLEADDLAREGHPDVRIARLQVDVARQQLDALLATVKPTVAFSLNATEAMAEGTRSDKTEFSAQLKLSSPLLPTGSVKAKSRSLSASLQAAKFGRDDTLRQTSLAVRNAFRNLETARAQRGAVNAELIASRLVATGITNEFQFGQKTTLDVLDAEQDVNDAELRGIDADHAILMAAFRLRLASGRLNASSFGIEDVLGPLQAMPSAEVPFTGTLSPKVAVPPEGDFTGLSTQANEAEDVILPQSAATAETTVPVKLLDDEVVTPVVSGNGQPVIVETGGVVWNIQTSLP